VGGNTFATVLQLQVIIISLNFANMNTRVKKVAPKGDRLNWTPLKEVKQVKISANHLKGNVLTANCHMAKSATSTLLVP